MRDLHPRFKLKEGQDLMVEQEGLVLEHTTENMVKIKFQEIYVKLEKKIKKFVGAASYNKLIDKRNNVMHIISEFKTFL